MIRSKQAPQIMSFIALVIVASSTSTGTPAVTASPVDMDSVSPSFPTPMYPRRLGAEETAVTVLDIILNDPELESFRDLLVAADVVEAFGNLAEISVFPPINSAFEGRDSEFLARILQPEWVNHLIETISIHIGFPVFLRRDLVNRRSIELLNTQFIRVNITEGVTTLQNSDFDGVRILEFDLVATNGVVHKIDTIMKPRFFFTDMFQLYASRPFLFGTFIEMIVIADLESMFRSGYYTILAPTSSAFRALPEGNLPFLRAPGNENITRAVVLNHVIEGLVPAQLNLRDGDRLTVITDGNEHVVVLGLTDDDDLIFTIGGADVVEFDRLANNGLGYALAGVLIPDSVGLPADMVSGMPSTTPSIEPSVVASSAPSSIASNGPTLSNSPSTAPSGAPSGVPSNSPVAVASLAPSLFPSITPSMAPSRSPSPTALCFTWLQPCESREECCSGYCRRGRCRLLGFGELPDFR